MLLANYSTSPKLSHASQYFGSNIRAARPIAKIFSELLFMAIRGRKTCLDNYVRHLHLSVKLHFGACSALA